VRDVEAASAAFFVACNSEPARSEMTAQKGKDLLLKVDTNGSGSFATVAGLRARSLAFNAATVDITDQESAGRWRELLEGAGLKTARISGSGIFKDAASDETLRQYFFNGTVRAWRVIVPELGTVEGLFQIATLEYGGQHDGEVTFDLGLESAGALTFTPAE
jgi:TP901-1 family phage major tail protein